jgi:hypothetical protein
MALQIQKILNKGLIAGLAVSALSFFLKIVPCTTSPVIAEPQYSWGFCKLPNPFKGQLVGLSQKFYGSFADPMAGLIIQFLIAFALFITIFTFFHKVKNKRILDLTGK